MSTRIGILIIILLQTIVFSGCGNHVWHYVRKGDTLYSVSFRYGQDYRQVAQWNRIAPPYIISPGQRLRVGPPPGSKSVLRDKAPVHADEHHSLAVTDAGITHSTGKPLSKSDNGRIPDKQSAVSARTGVAQPPVYPQKVTWYWPAGGKIIHSFSPGQPGLKGIDIAGYKGGAVKAAASGRVVYAGEGLASYGRLIIIKHNEQFLSAYAHNRKLLVEEGQNVEAGSVIAEMGDSGTDRVKLHFEVRKRGRPVNPLLYLPKH